MKPDPREQKHKEIRRYIKQYWKLRDEARDAGSWVEVEPYQSGWNRTYVLRDDAKLRPDVHHLRVILDKLNTEQFSRRQDFKVWDWKTHQYEDRPQPLKWLTEQKYNELSEKHKSYFTMMFSYDKYSKKIYPVYVFRYDYLYRLEITENIVTHHWIPDSEVQQRVGEMEHHIKTHDLWPKYSKATSFAHHNGYRYDRDDLPKYRNLQGMTFEEFE